MEPVLLHRSILLSCLDSVEEAVIVTESAASPDAQPRIVYVNAYFERLTGYAEAEVLGRTLDLLTGPSTDEAQVKRLCRALRSGVWFRSRICCYRKDGEVIEWCWSVNGGLSPGTDPRHSVAVLRPSSHQDPVERRLARVEAVARIFRLTAGPDQDLDQVFQKVVDAAIEVIGADAAVFQEREGQEMVYRAVGGIASDSLGLRLPMDSSLSGYCYALGRGVICTDAMEDERVPDKETARQIGFRSGLLVPLMAADEAPLGILKLYSSRPGAFDEDHMAILEEVSGFLVMLLEQSYSVAKSRDRQRLLIDSLPVLISYIDSSKRYRDVNDAYLKWFGMNRSSIVDHHVREVLGDDAYDTIRPYVDAALRGESVNFESEVPYAHGGTRPVEADYIPYQGRHGQIEGFYVLVRDITDRKRAERDYLTRLYNRRAFESFLASVSATARRYDHRLSLIVLDLDNFKRVNDTYGHAAGDQTLQATAALLRERVRKADIVCRWGGEEFAVLLPETPAEQACRVAEDIRRSIRCLEIDGAKRITASFGVGELDPAESMDGFIARIDAALYQAKALGRDRVECVGTAPPR